MDMMDVRRMVMSQMANGADFVKGSFTIPDNDGSTYTINFGKTFSKYLYIIEMTDDSKSALLSTGATDAKAFSMIGASITPTVSTYTGSVNYFTYRIKPSTQGFTANQNSAITVNTTSLTLPTGAVTGSMTNSLYKGYSYNYYVVEIK